MQRGLVSEHAEDDRLLVLTIDRQAVKPGSPPAVQDARNADLVPRRPTGDGHLRAREPLAWARWLSSRSPLGLFRLHFRVGTGARAGRQPKVYLAGRTFGGRSAGTKCGLVGRID